jgi:putative transposase
MMAIAEMYIQGVSTRDVQKVMVEFGIESLSSTQVSRAAKRLDTELDAWRNRALGVVRYMVLDARYEKVRIEGVVRDAAILTAMGVDDLGVRRVLGVSVALSEAEVHWRAFLDASFIWRRVRSITRQMSRPGRG